MDASIEHRNGCGPIPLPRNLHVCGPPDPPRSKLLHIIRLSPKLIWSSDCHVGSPRALRPPPAHPPSVHTHVHRPRPDRPTPPPRRPPLASPPTFQLTPSTRFPSSASMPRLLHPDLCGISGCCTGCERGIDGEGDTGEGFAQARRKGVGAYDVRIITHWLESSSVWTWRYCTAL